MARCSFLTEMFMPSKFSKASNAELILISMSMLVFVGCRDGEFNWNTYVKNCRGQLAPKHFFKSLNTVSCRVPCTPPQIACALLL